MPSSRRCTWSSANRVGANGLVSAGRRVPQEKAAIGVERAAIPNSDTVRNFERTIVGRAAGEPDSPIRRDGNSAQIDRISFRSSLQPRAAGPARRQPHKPRRTLGQEMPSASKGCNASFETDAPLMRPMKHFPHAANTGCKP